MRRDNTDRPTQNYVKSRIFYPIIAFILFVIFHNTFSYFLFVFFSVVFMWIEYAENCKVFYIKIKNSSFSRFITDIVMSILYIPYLLLVCWVLIKIITFLILSFTSNIDILTSEYFNGVCLIISSVFVTLAWRLFHNIVFKEMEKESNDSKMRGD
ncbi:hypothetical protein MmiEs2_16300 [Methanimicrococcus stummii]|uniref:Uncharacterized protein n=1 Tax=Methanimicrococcus stummii TaxID=3028294 RepID=A0AA96VCM4_9EURY|nr:hypothetical protein MmiEs2_16300 [Methanimicrococcus sp. Es2]